MKQPFFTGACTALVTPFLGGKVNYPMMEQLLRRQIDAGIEAVVICGTTGESATLSDCEKLELFRRAKAYAGDNCLIIAGTSLTVYPAASFVRYFRGKYLVLINRDETPMDKNADLVIHDKVGEVLSKIKV